MDNGWTRKFCYECSPHEDENMTHAQAVTIKRRAIKKMLIERAGGRCVRCGYNKSQRALEFHHQDPNEKDFTRLIFSRFAKFNTKLWKES